MSSIAAHTVWCRMKRATPLPPFCSTYRLFPQVGCGAMLVPLFRAGTIDIVALNIYIYIYRCVCVYVCMYVCMYVCIYTHIYIVHIVHLCPFQHKGTNGRRISPTPAHTHTVETFSVFADHLGTYPQLSIVFTLCPIVDLPMVSGSVPPGQPPKCDFSISW